MAGQALFWFVLGSKIVWTKIPKINASLGNWEVIRCCCWSVLLNSGCILGPPGEFLKCWCLSFTHRDPDLTGLLHGLCIGIFFQVPQIILMCSQGWEPILWRNIFSMVLWGRIKHKTFFRGLKYPCTVILTKEQRDLKKQTSLLSLCEKKVRGEESNFHLQMEQRSSQKRLVTTVTWPVPETPHEMGQGLRLRREGFDERSREC